MSQSYFTAPSVVDQDRWARLVIPLLALVTVAPLVVQGCSCGHDFDFHLLSWIEAAQQIAHGNLHPHWAFTPAYNAGEPRFVFYPPLSWYLGAGIGLVLQHLPRVTEVAAWTAAPIFFTWIALALSGQALFHLARKFTGPNAALLASALYIANPYMLFTAFERTAYAELLAAAWIPLLLEAILRERPDAVSLAIPVALLWLTNAPAAVMGCYALALVGIVRLLLMMFSDETDTARSTQRFAFQISGGVLLGLALAAFYIVPAAWERRYVQAAMATIGGMNITQNFLFQHTGTTPDDLLHDQVLHTASIIAVLLIVVTIAAFILLRMRRDSRTVGTHRLLPLAILTLAIAFALTPASALFWRLTPEARFLQFPWRLLALLAPVCVLGVAACVGDAIELPPRGARKVYAALASVACVIALNLPAWHFFHQTCDTEDMAAGRIRLFHSATGTEPTDEYTPTTADNDALHSGNPPYWLGESATTAAAPAGVAGGVSPTQITLDTPRPQSLILNLRDYPAWRITLATTGSAAQVVADREPRADGLIAIAVPAGRSHVAVHYGRLPDQTLGDLISLGALGVLAFSLRRRRLTALALPL